MVNDLAHMLPTKPNNCDRRSGRDDAAFAQVAAETGLQFLSNLLGRTPSIRG